MKKETIEKHRILGLCLRCSEKAVKDRTLCLYHLEKSAQKSEKRRNKLKINNLCLICGELAREGKQTCVDCGNKCAVKSCDRNKVIYQKRKLDGTCIRCGKNNKTDKVHCLECQEYMRFKDKRKYRELKDNGICVHCGEKRDLKGILCNNCRINNGNRGKKYSKRLKQIIINHYGGKCFCCGEKELCFLELDHMNGGGNKHREEIRQNSTTTYRWIVKNNFPVNFQILCSNCNSGKYRNGGICPHQQEDPNLLDVNDFEI